MVRRTLQHPSPLVVLGALPGTPFPAQAWGHPRAAFKGCPSLVAGERMVAERHPTPSKPMCLFFWEPLKGPPLWTRLSKVESGP